MDILKYFLRFVALCFGGISIYYSSLAPRIYTYDTPEFINNKLNPDYSHQLHIENLKSFNEFNQRSRKADKQEQIDYFGG